MLETVRGAPARIDGFEPESESAPVQSLRTASRIDLDHTCRDTAALIDPGRSLSITIPEAIVHADAGALHAALQALLESVACKAHSYIHVSVSPDPRKPHVVGDNAVRAVNQRQTDPAIG